MQQFNSWKLVRISFSFESILLLLSLQKYGYLSSKYVHNVTINSTNENSSSTTTIATTITTETSPLSMITLENLTSEPSSSTSAKIDEISLNDFIPAISDEDKEYM